MRAVMKARRVMQDGLVFDSTAECKRYNELRCLAMAKKIKGFKVKPEYILIPKNDKFRAMTYTPDFLVIYPDGHEELEDVKGNYYHSKSAINMAAMRVFKMKEKMLYHVHKLTVKVVIL